MPPARPQPTAAAAVLRLRPDGSDRVDDRLATEEPLGIRVAAGDEVAQVAVTMRTPGDDAELAVGWLLAEGVVSSRADVRDVSWCVRDDATPRQRHNVVTVTLAAPGLPDLSSLERHGLLSSACGVCGTAALEDLAAAGLTPVEQEVHVPLDVLLGLPARLEAAQAGFASTGGLHAAGRFTRDGAFVALREDVGRHNALDKLLGAALLDGDPWGDDVLLLSGRASYELLQKAVVGRVPVVAAVGAPSSLAVDVAAAFGITLVGFLRHDRANVYTRPERVLAGVPA